MGLLSVPMNAKGQQMEEGLGRVCETVLLSGWVRFG